MRANTTIAVLANIAVHAENLKAFREFVFSKPLVKLRSAATVYATLTHFCAIVFNVVDTQEQRLCLSATRTLVTTISSKHLLTKLCVKSCGFVGLFPAKLRLFFWRHLRKHFSPALYHLLPVRLALSGAVVAGVLSVALLVVVPVLL